MLNMDANDMTLMIQAILCGARPDSLHESRDSGAPSSLSPSAVSNPGVLSRPCSPAAPVGLPSTLASAGPSPLNSYNNNLLQLLNQFILAQQQANGLEGPWQGNDGEHGTAPRACIECRQLRKEWQSMKECFTGLQNSLALLVHHQNLAAASLNGGQSALFPGLTSSLPQLMLTRKRPIPLAPDCSTTFKPLPTACLQPSMFPWAAAAQFGLPAPSPTMAPNVPEPTPSVEQPLTVEQKWSNPSSVESNGNKTDSSAGESTNIDIVGMDGSESSTSSTSTQAMVTSPDRHSYSAYIKDQTNTFRQPCHPYKMYKTELGVPISAALPMNNNSPTERKHRKNVSDDYVKLIRSQDLSEQRIGLIQIPVEEATKCDPSFRAVSEQQIVQQVVQSKKFESQSTKESMIALCKRLAEKRVFGAKLMALTTVAGLNHSNYTNLPDEEIIYIQHVCRKVMGDKFDRDDDFWDVFRDATKKLAARCRRVRHAKKSKKKDVDGMSISDDQKPAICSDLAVRATYNSLNLHMPSPIKREPRPISIESRLPIDQNERTAAETLQSLSRQETLVSAALLQGFNGLLPNQNWDLLGKLQREPKREYDADIEPISP